MQLFDGSDAEVVSGTVESKCKMKNRPVQAPVFATIYSN